MKTSTEYLNLSHDFAEKQLARYKEKFGDNLIECDDKTALFLLSQGYLEGRIAGEFDVYKTQDNVQKYLNYLTTAGWSELIDERHKDEVNEQLKTAFPNITDDEINQVNKLVLI